MAGPRKKFRQRPKKVGAKKRQRIKAQKRRIVAKGVKEESLKNMTVVDIRNAHKKVHRRKRIKAKPKKAVKK